jgi:hypothetical protein
MSQTVEAAPAIGAEEGLAALVQKSRETWRRLGRRRKR